jgi:FkbM family methyltransferase
MEVFENLCNLLVEDPVIRVDEFQGRFVVDCRSDLFSRLVSCKEYEPKLVQHCMNLVDKNRDVIDVGANVGFFTVMFAKNLSGRKVLSIEPTTNALSRLHRNIRLNDVDANVIVFEGVASNRIGEIEIKTVEGKEEYSSIGEMTHPSISEARFTIQKAASSTIDDLVKRHALDPGFMKVDVEGAEHLVFEGSTQVLELKRPIILSELSNYLLRKNGSSSLDVIRFISQYSYDVFDPINPDVPPGTKDFGDILCVPKEMGCKIS